MQACVCPEDDCLNEARMDDGASLFMDFVADEEAVEGGAGGGTSSQASTYGKEAAELSLSQETDVCSALGPSVESCGASAVVRRRVKGKGGKGPQLPHNKLAAFVAAVELEKTAAAAEGRTKYRQYDVVRSVLVTELLVEERDKRKKYAGKAVRDIRPVIAKLVKNLGDKKQRMLVRRHLERVGAELTLEKRRCLETWLEGKAFAEDAAESKQKKPRGHALDFLNGRFGLLTWNSPSWVWGKAALGVEALDLFAACDHLQGHYEVQQIINGMLHDICSFVETHHIQKYSGSVEICPQTFLQGDVRLHVHVGVLNITDSVVIKEAAAATVQGSLPHMSWCKRGGDDASGLGVATGNACLFYTGVRKVGQASKHRLGKVRKTRGSSRDSSWIRFIKC